MDAFVGWFWGTGWFWVVVFWVGLVVNGRAVFKLLLDWRGMATPWRFVDAAYRRLDALPDEAALEHETAAPVFVHVVPAWEEPAIAVTLRALLDSRYPHGKLHVVVVTKEAEEQAPHPLMEAPTAELVRRFRAELPPWQQKQLSQPAMARARRLARVTRPVFEFCFRRSQICLGHHELVRLDTLQSIGLFPVSGATEDSTLGYALGARGILIRALPLLELVDIPETTEGMIRQNARWYKGVLDDVRFLWETWRTRRSAFNLAQLCRHVGNKAVEWPVAAALYPVLGFLAWHLAYRFASRPVWFALGVLLPTLSLGLTVWVGGIATQSLIERLTRYCPRPVTIARTTLGAKLWGTFRCQTYWLLATRAAWRVLWGLGRTGRYEPAKADRA